MSVKSLWKKLAFAEIEFVPVAGAGFRILWISAALLLFPGILCRFLVPHWALLLAGLSGGFALFMPLKNFPCKRLTVKDIYVMAAAFPGLMLSSALVTELWKKLLSGAGISFPEKQSLAEMISTSSAADAAVLFAAVCIVTPCLEETLFRRLIYSLWHKIHPASAFAGTALLFAAIHFFVTGLPGLFVLGCGFQYVFLKCRNLACAVIVHALVNCTAFFVNIT